MKNSINLNSAEWCDLVFKNKNKEYGAYALRLSSGKRHIWAFGIVVLLMVVVSVLPAVINTVKAKNIERSEGIKDVITVLDLEQEKEQLENVIERDIAPPPPPIRASIQFVPPVISRDEDVTDDDQMITQEEVLSDARMISVETINNDNLNMGIDIATIKQNEQIIEKPKEPEIFISVEQMPQFKGGTSEMYRFIADNLKYPVIAQQNGIQGRVTVRFVVLESGAISDVQVLRGIDAACDKEAMRVVKSMPDWFPGKQNGKEVKVYFTLPIVFKLN